MVEQKSDWSLEIMGSFAPIYTTSSRGANDYRGPSGQR